MNERGFTMAYESLKLKNQLCFRLYATSKAMTRLYKPLLEALHLTYPQYITMMVVWEEETVNFKKLGEKVHMKTGTLTPILQKLEKLGYLKKYRDEHDDRKILVACTEKGFELRDQALSVPNNIFCQANLTMEEFETYKKVLDELSIKLLEAEKKMKGERK